MAAISVNSAGGETSTGPITLTAGAADTVTFNQDVDVIRVITDVSGTTEVNIRIDGGAAAVGGKFSYRLTAQAPVLTVSVGAQKVFSVISATAQKYSIEKVVTASVTLEPPHPWVPGTTVSLYKGIRPSSGLPSGSPVTSATVDVTDLSLVFDGLAEGGTYFAYASGQSVAITASPMSLLPEKTVSDYWIAGDADDTNAFSRAVDAVIADGRGVVRFQSGKTYTISSIAKTVDNLTILAYGAYIKSTLGKTTAVTVVDLHGNNLQVLGGTWDYTTTSTVNTDASARVSAFYFRFGINNPGWTFYTGLLVRDTLILNSRNTGIGVYATSRARVLSNTIITALGNGMFCSNNPFDLEIVGNFIYDTGDDAIAVVTDPPCPRSRSGSRSPTITYTPSIRGLTARASTAA
jgi:hypothetical protein